MQILNRKHRAFLNSLTDAELVQMYKELNDTKIVGEFYERYHHLVFGVCLKYMKNNDRANDATLEIYSSLYVSIKKYEIGEFKHWLLTVARNHCIKLLKKYSKEIPFNDSLNSSSSFMEMHDESNHIYIKEKQLNALDRAIEELKPEQAQCIRLFFLEDKSYHDIVDTTGFDLKKVKSYIQNGKRNLGIALQNINDEED